jgi:hypothetical protein
MSRSLSLCAAIVAGAALGACSSSGTNAAPDGGNAMPDAGGTSMLTAYQRLGSHAGLLAFVKGEVENKVLQDTNLKTYFFNQVATPIPAGHPSAGQIEECFTRLVASVVQAETYPGTPVADAANTNTPSFTCRGMAASHVGLKIGDKTFDAFIGVIAADLMPLVVPDGTELTAGHISQTEFNVLAKGLTDQKTAIVDPTAASGPAPFPG